MPEHIEQEITKLLNNLGSKQSGNEIRRVYVKFQKNNFPRKIIQKMWPKN